MFCPKCGTEIQNNSRFCTRCGYRLDNSNFSNCISHTQNRKGNVTSNSTIRLIIIISAIGLVLFLIWLLGDVSLESANAEENIRKLKTFTSLEKENDIYVFNYNDQWSIRYSDENEAVRFNDANAGQCVGQQGEMKLAMMVHLDTILVIMHLDCTHIMKVVLER